MSTVAEQAARRRTFAIISHPDAGKTTLTEKLLLFGGAIQLAGTVKGRKASRHATSDWMKIEQQRGISVTTSVMQFPYKGRIVNLLDTPGHEDFSEDTYRTLTAVDSALMVIDAAKGVEPRTIKLMEVCRMRTTPIVSFINKLDREGRPPLELLDEIEQVLSIPCSPITWPIGMGSRFKGVYHLLEDRVYRYRGDKHKAGALETLDGLGSDAVQVLLGDERAYFMEEIEMARHVCPPFDLAEYRAGRLTPVFFGSAINNFGVQNLLDGFVEWAPPPSPRAAFVAAAPGRDPAPVVSRPGAAATTDLERQVNPAEDRLSGFVFKIQANMDPRHRDRIAFLRVCSGKYAKGMQLHQVRSGKSVRITDAVTFMAAERQQAEEAWPGDILGLHNHGTIALGDSFSEGEQLVFRGVPNFAPELFRRVVLKDPLKAKALNKGLDQLCEEGATQVFRPLSGNDVILGAVGSLQFDVVKERLEAEYGVNCVFDISNIWTARWVDCDDDRMMREFREKNEPRLALDHSEALVFLANSRVNLEMAQERHPQVSFRETREQKF